MVYIQKFKQDFLRTYCADLNQILYERFQVPGNDNLLTRCWSHDQDGHDAHIYGKNPSKIFSGTGRPISTKLGMKHLGLQPIIVCSNDDPGMTLTYFTARSNSVTYAFLLEKVRTVDFSETIAARDLKVGSCRQQLSL